MGDIYIYITKKTMAHHQPSCTNYITKKSQNDVCDINNDMCDNLIMHHKYGDNLMSKAGFVNYDYG